MKPNELMLGNLVNAHRSECVGDGGRYMEWEEFGKVTRIYEDTAMLLFPTREDDWEEIDIKDLEPIPLTPEILEKNGFVCTQKADEIEEAYECWSFHDGLLSILFEPDVVMLEVHNGGENSAVRTINYYTDNDVLYVHELQNAMRLCRIEKEIIL